MIPLRKMKPKFDRGPRDPARLKKMGDPVKQYAVVKFVAAPGLLAWLDTELQTDQHIANRVGLHRTTVRAIRLGRSFGKRTAAHLVARTGDRASVIKQKG